MTTLSPQELRSKGIKILTEGLGPVDAARFLMQFDTGHGDYTKERHAWLDKYSIDDISKELQEHKERKAIHHD